MVKTSTILDEYINYLDKYILKYGQRTIVLMQVGMFHEFYGVDNYIEKLGYVREVSDILNIQMTRRDKKVPDNSRKNFLMAGFPTASIDRYVNILLENGYNVVIVDQLTPPPNVVRGVTKVYSPGTYIDECRRNDNNYLMTIYFQLTSIASHKYINKKIKPLIKAKKQVLNTPVIIPNISISERELPKPESIPSLQPIIPAIKSSSITTPNVERFIPTKSSKKYLLAGLSVVDLSTGEGCIYEAWSGPNDSNFAIDETYRFIQAHDPMEIVIYMPEVDGHDTENVQNVQNYRRMYRIYRM